VYGKAFSVFGRELDMITQDSLRFYKSHAVYDDFGGIVLDREEGVRIAKVLGDGKACILQNHGLLTVGQSVDEAAFWFISLDKTCHAQLLVDAASAGSGHKKIFIRDEEAAFTYGQVGTPEKGWLVCKISNPPQIRYTDIQFKAFQGYYDEQLAKTGGSFLK
jgi:ribulose-5-phosphate 4-epimerase/fuculose-1-phosphate aldolase